MAKKIKLDYKLLNYDIENSHLKGRFWRPGEQVMRHGQLLPNGKSNLILTISYKWWHEDKVHTLDCGEDGRKLKEMIATFDDEIRKADVVIGKNNHGFDDGHLNTARLLTDGTPMPEWSYKSDDVEKQIRRYFKLPSYSLDYIASLLGFGGKMKMEEEDWNKIEDMIEYLYNHHYLQSCISQHEFCKYFYNKTPSQVMNQGRIAFKKMKEYNKIDVIRTEQILSKILPHVQLKYNAATKDKKVNPNLCITCGSGNIEHRDIVTRGQTRRRNFYCYDHKGYAGSRPCIKDAYGHAKYTGTMGK